ncbi:MAG: competence/damage-inducible protein CinA [Osedax symbiont Rs1]|nr:MAG: competence/damage-inducible protein CinA [Osedax symbiont Rs1]
MKLEMICTGEEILAGQIVDTNAAWLGNILIEHGFEMDRRTTVGDRLDDLQSVFVERSQVADIILVNGGLGPTADDLSTLAISKAMGVELIENSQWRATLQQWSQQRGLTLTASNLKQAMLPAGAIIVDNPVGTACGFRVPLNRAWLFFTPGVPHEFKVMIEQQFLPFLRQQSSSNSQVSVSKLLTLGMGESAMAEVLEKLQWPAGITLGYRSFMPYVELKLIARDTSEASQQQALKIAQQALGDTIVASNQGTLAAEVHRLLIAQGQTLSIAESLTGGDICSQLVAFAGSSAYLKQGIVSYCNEAKIQLLNVAPAIIAQHSEVSLACVAQMAEGVAKAVPNLQAVTDFSIATSGMAGPGGGSEKIPVGTVVIAVKAKRKIYCQQLQLASNRSRAYIRELTAAVALDMLRRAILELVPIADYDSIKCVARQVYDID